VLKSLQNQLLLPLSISPLPWNAKISKQPEFLARATLLVGIGNTNSYSGLNGFYL